MTGLLNPKSWGVLRYRFFLHDFRCIIPAGSRFTAGS